MATCIAGASGMVGQALHRAFETDGRKVYPLSRMQVDFRDSEKTLDVLGKIKPEILIISAAVVGGINRNNSQPVEILVDNLSVQNSLMMAALKLEIPRVIFLGSSCIYPRDCPQPIKEESLHTGQLEPSNSAYAIAKLAGIELVSSIRKQYGLKWISLMPTNLYGPYDNFSLMSSHVVPGLIRKFVDAVDSGVSEVTLWGTGEPLREFLHVDDLADAVLYVCDKYDSSLPLNVGYGKDISIKDLAYKIANSVGYRGVITWDHSQPSGTPRKLLDSSKIINLGWEPKIDLDTGILETVAWFRQARMLGLARL